MQKDYDDMGEKSFKFILLEECKKELLLKREQYYIDSLSPKYNTSPTAGSCKGLPTSEEAKRKISETLKGNTPWNKGIPQSEDQKKAHSERMTGRISGAKGKKWSEESKKAISIARTGLPAKNRMVIEQYTLEGVFIKEFSSQAEAQRETGSKGITHAINGRYKQVNGFIWKKKERSQPPL